MTYNVHSCMGLDGRYSVTRIAEVLHRYQPDFVCLQELDCRTARSLGEDQLEEIKNHWPSEGSYFPLLTVGRGSYGIGYLSRVPIVEFKSHLLPTAEQLIPQERRGVMCVTVRLECGANIEIFNTHLGLTRRERQAQIDGLLNLARTGKTEGVRQVLAGDFNCSPRTAEYRRIHSQWKSSQKRPEKTWFSSFPLRHLDFCFLRGDLEVSGSYVPKDSLTRAASDHLPLITDLKVL